MTKIRNHSAGAKRLPIEELRKRIALYVQCGGLYPISETGIRNIARRFYISKAQVEELIREVENSKEGVIYG